MMSARCSLAGLLLLVFLVVTRGAAAATSQLRAAGRPTFVFGVFNAALPFWLIAWGEKHIDSTRRGDRAGDGADLRVRRRAPLPPSRARVADPVGRRRARARGRGRADRRRPARRLVGGGGDARRRAVVALVRRRRHVRAAPAPRHARARCSPPGACSSAACCSCRSRSFQLPDEAPGWEAVALRRSARDPRHDDRAARLLPHAAALRQPANLARRLRHAGLRDRVRRALPRPSRSPRA